MIRVHHITDSIPMEQLLARPSRGLQNQKKITRSILKRVRNGGDKALRKLALEYDHVSLDNFWVEDEEVRESLESIPASLSKAMHTAKENIWKFHEKQKRQGYSIKILDGLDCGCYFSPIQSVGLYIPGGSAPLFSTVFMLGIPAKIAGCSEIMITTPTNRIGKVPPPILFASHMLGIDRICKLGGVQAIAALSYGTESVPKVDKIFGPGNQYVTLAKQIVGATTVAVDLPAGPSEVMVLVDKYSQAGYAAADLLAQAEHGEDSHVVLVSLSKRKSREVLESLKVQLAGLNRRQIIEKALKNSLILNVNSVEQAIEVVNKYRPEHLICNLADNDPVVEKVQSAGSIFIGPYTPEVLGDYVSGTNHTLPTRGWANAYSGVSLDSFLKRITYQKASKKALEKLGPVASRMAKAEGMEAHERAISIRLDE